MIRIAFIGVGGYGRTQLERFLPHHRSGEIRIVGLADPSSLALHAALAMPGLEAVPCFSDDQTLLAELAVDAVIVSAPIPFHREITARLLSKGIFVLLEKPPVTLLSELEELIELDVQSRAMVGFQYCYSGAAAAFRRRFWGGEVGTPLSLSASGIWPRDSEYYNRSGWAGKVLWGDRVVLDGPATNAMSHFLNLLFFLAAEPPALAEVPSAVEGEVYRSRPMPSYDLCALRGEFPNGLCFSAGFSHAGAQMIPVTISAEGTSGEISLSEQDLRADQDAEGDPTGWDTRQRLVHAFLAFVAGDVSQNLTPLSAMKPYVLTTNLMLQSSGGIHPAGACDEENGLNAFARTIAMEGALFQSLLDQGISWGCRPRLLRSTDHCEATMLRGLTDPKANGWTGDTGLPICQAAG